MIWKNLILLASCFKLLGCAEPDPIYVSMFKEQTGLSIRDLEKSRFRLVPGEESLYELINADSLVGFAFDRKSGSLVGQYWNIRFSPCLIKSDIENLLISYGVSILAYSGYDSSTFYGQNMYTRNYYRCLSSSVGDTCFLSIHFDIPRTSTAPTEWQ